MLLGQVRLFGPRAGLGREGKADSRQYGRSSNAPSNWENDRADVLVFDLALAGDSRFGAGHILFGSLSSGPSVAFLLTGFRGAIRHGRCSPAQEDLSIRRFLCVSQFSSPMRFLFSVRADSGPEGFASSSSVGVSSKALTGTASLSSAFEEPADATISAMTS